MFLRLRIAATVFLLACSPALPALAGVTVETVVRNDGIRGMGAFEGTTVSAISGLRQREHSRIRFTGASLSVLQRMGAETETETITITRVDKGVAWTLNPEKGSYIEQPISAGRLGSWIPRQRRDRDTMDVIVTRSEFTTQPSGARREINEFSCEEYLVTWLLETLNQKTQEQSRSLMKTHLWTTPETGDLRRAREEEQTYYQAYLKRAGVEISKEETKRLALGMFASFSGASEKEIQRSLAQASAEWNKVQGYPILIRVEWTVEGQEVGGGTRFRGSQEEPFGLGGLLGGLLGGGRSPLASSSGGSEGPPLISLTTEVKRVRVGPIPWSRFEVPGDYARQ